MLQFAFGSGKNTDQINDRMTDVFYNLKDAHKGYWDYINTSGPNYQTVQAGGTATFKVTLFGDNLTYQWQYYNTSIGKWENVNSPSAKTPTLKITATRGMNNRQFGCIVTNKNGNCIYSDIAKLTVS